MSAYESTVIFSPELPPEKVEELLDKVKKIIESAGGTIGLVQNMGKKRMSYPINHFAEGSYVYVEFAGPGNIVGDLEKFYKVTDAVIRFLTVHAVKKVPPAPPRVVEAPVAAPEQKNDTVPAVEAPVADQPPV